MESEDALQVDEARRVGGGMEIAPPCGPAPARRITVARIAAACRAFAIEDEIDGQSIRLSFEAHESGGSISTVHDPPASHREGRASGNIGRRSDAKAEPNASAKGGFDQGLWIGVRLGAPKEAVGEAGGDAVWLDHGGASQAKGERQA